jgi:pseudaminic acid biosynthesis-associated methylase
MSDSEPTPHLEALWAGDFGDQYVARHLDAGSGRRSFWREQLARLQVQSVLEVGCNVGANLTWLAELLGPSNVAGVDVNRKALELLRERIPGMDARLANGRKLPFEDASFDLVFTTGVLIHQDPGELPTVMAEVVRCARRYVLCGEYYAEQLTEVPYHGQQGALFKHDYGALYQRLFPQLQAVDHGFLSRKDGDWDDVTYWVFRKP